jgi:hypothetical protein
MYFLFFVVWLVAPQVGASGVQPPWVHMQVVVTGTCRPPHTLYWQSRLVSVIVGSEFLTHDSDH